MVLLATNSSRAGPAEVSLQLGRAERNEDEVLHIPIILAVSVSARPASLATCAISSAIAW